MSSFWLSFPIGTFILVKKNYSRSETKLNELFNFWVHLKWTNQISYWTVLRQDDDVIIQGTGIGLPGQNSVPSKHDVISCLGVAGRWITSHQDLQVRIL